MVVRSPLRAAIAAFMLALGTFAWAVVARADEVIKIQHQEIERQTVLHQPASLGGAPAPLVIALQGLGEDTESLKKWLRLDATADREGFRVLYPDAIDHSWSYGRPINQPMPKIGDATVDDIGFIRRLIDDLIVRKIADPARIYATGPSRGGLMTYSLACALADRIAAMAPLISGMTEYQREDCRPARAMPIMVLAGTADPAQSFGGGQGLVGRLLSVPDTMNYWRTLHGCTGRTARALPHRDPSDQTRLTVIEWTGCRYGGRVWLYRVEGGGHQIPSFATESSPEGIERFGLRNRDIETADEIWKFFTDAPR